MHLLRQVRPTEFIPVNDAGVSGVIEWELTAKLPKPMSSPASRILDGRLYVIGGWDGRTEEGTTMADKKWLSSPEVWVADAPVF
jgi:hypothetical protein|tara:strand:- start:2720 stop:2971 length:252 start_codon:yes stop_codon:yes gene_type:complete